MARGIFRQIFADAVEIVAPSADAALKLSADQRKHFEKLVRRLDGRIDDDFPGQSNVSCFGKEGKWKTRGQSETFFLITSAMFEVQSQVDRKLTSRRQISKISA